MKLRSNKMQNTRNAALARLGRFRTNDEGGMIIFSLILFVLILTFGGMAVDLMRFETTRTKLQGTLDRATLAAADLDQTLPPADVVIDYFTKAGMLEFLVGDPDIEEGLNYRRVSAVARVEMPLFFYDLPRVFMSPFTPGLTTMSVNGASTAEQRVTDVEVSLVLDVSGSMGSNQRITNLRPAAKEFVSTVLATNTGSIEGLTTVSVVPYAATVNLGSLVAPLMNINRTQDFSTCMLFDDEIFETTALDLTNTYNHVSHFDAGWWSTYNSGLEIKVPWCPIGERNAIVPFTSDEDYLYDIIDDLAAFGNTAIDLGMKWGVALLDPSTVDIANSLAGEAGTNVPAIAAGRPGQFDDADLTKVIVLMTDGQNTQEYDLKPFYKYGLSSVWFNMDDPIMSLSDVDDADISIQYSGFHTIYDFSDDMFFIQTDSSNWITQNYPKGFSSNSQYANEVQSNGASYAPGFSVNILSPGYGITYESVGSVNNYRVRNASWQDLFATWKITEVNDILLQNAYDEGFLTYGNVTKYAEHNNQWLRDSNNQYIRIEYPGYIHSEWAQYTIVGTAAANNRLSDICEAARENGIVIYTVAFEAPPAGQTAMRDCATSTSTYFDVNGTDISEAFASIASDIRSLRLTQ